MNTAQRNYKTVGNPKKIPSYSERRPGSKARRKEEISPRDKKNILVLILVCGLIAIGMIIAGAYAASVNYQNNRLREENAALQSEVDSLRVDLESKVNLANIEKRASSELGMVYPDGDRLVVIKKHSAKQTENDLAAELKKNAFE